MIISWLTRLIVAFFLTASFTIIFWPADAAISSCNISVTPHSAQPKQIVDMIKEILAGYTREEVPTTTTS